MESSWNKTQRWFDYEVIFRTLLSFTGTMLEFTRLIRESLFDDIGLIDLKNKKFIYKKKTRAGNVE